MKSVVRSALVLAFTLPLPAQAETEYLKTKALSFSFNGLSLSGINGGVGGKMWVSNDRALTLSVDGTVSSRFTKGDSIRVDNDESYSEVRLNAGIEQHAFLGQGFSPFLTAGLSFGYNQRRYTYGSAPDPYEAGTHYTAFGAVAGVGLEYWITQRVSLTGQQLLSATYQTGKAFEGPENSPERDSHEYLLGLGTSSLILSVYL